MIVKRLLFGALLNFSSVLQFWDDPWWGGEPLSQDRRQHYVSNSGRKQRSLFLVHLQPPVSQPLPWVGVSDAFKRTNSVKLVTRYFLNSHVWDLDGLLCSPGQPRHPAWWMSRSKSASTSTLKSFLDSCTMQTHSASGSSVPRPNCAALILSRWDILYHTHHGSVVNKAEKSNCPLVGAALSWAPATKEVPLNWGFINQRDFFTKALNSQHLTLH